jgi:hypothetical protein
MILAIYTLVHVVISLLGIASGFVVLYGFLTAKLTRKWTSFFLATTVATSVTGFFFPFHGFTPAYAVGAVSLLVLAAAIYALRFRRLAGGWRSVYVINAVAALYFNVFVLIAQLFQKVPALKAIAPTQSEPPFAMAQGVVLVLFVALGITATVRFRAAPVPVS